MEYNKVHIDNYIQAITNEFLTTSVEEIKKRFDTDRLCWAFIIWTYGRLGLLVEDEGKLRLLIKKFHRIQESYRFPDIVLFKGDKGGMIRLTRHAGIMLDENKFVHMGRECNGLQITRLNVLPWNKLDRMVIRNYALDSNK